MQRLLIDVPVASRVDEQSQLSAAHVERPRELGNGLFEVLLALKPGFQLDHNRVLDQRLEVVRPHRQVHPAVGGRQLANDGRYPALLDGPTDDV